MSKYNLSKLDLSFDQTAAQAKQPQNTPHKKIISLFSHNTLIGSVSKELSDNEIEILSSIFESVDKEDLSGNAFNEDETNDSLLNENEQKNLKEILKEKYPKIYNIVNKYIENLENKSDTEKIVNNFNLLTDDKLGFLSDLYTEYCLDSLNTDNLLQVLSKYHGVSLLHDIYFDMCGMLDCELPTREEFEDDESYENSKQYIMEQKEKAAEKAKILKEKFTEFSNYLLNEAKKNNIYTKDYEKTIENALKNNDIKSLSILTQRLADRIIITTDGEKTLNASKRAIELKEPNGQIDSVFVQGYTGDCWFLSALSTIMADENMAEKINSMITVNKEGDLIKSITVKIQDKSYEIDYEMLKSANEYATGDLDVRALEIAVNQYMFENNILDGDISLGGETEEAYKILFGEDNIDIATYYNDNFDEYLEYIKNTENKLFSTIGTRQSLFSDINEKAYALNSNNEKVELPLNHAYKFSRVDDKYYYFTNPHSPEIELHIPLTEVADIFSDATTVKFKNDNETLANL